MQHKSLEKTEGAMRTASAKRDLHPVGPHRVCDGGSPGNRANTQSCQKDSTHRSTRET